MVFWIMIPRSLVGGLDILPPSSGQKSPMIDMKANVSPNFQEEHNMNFIAVKT
jgi:hypothetical protein